MAEEILPLKTRLDRLYHGRSGRARAFRLGLLAFDLAAITFFIASSMIEHMWWLYPLDALIGLVILADFSARVWMAPNRKALLLELTTWTDAVVILTLFLAPLVESFLFLRVLRALRLLRSYHVLKDLRAEFSFFRRNEDVIHSIINLAVFIFVVTALVYVLQVRTNPQINNYIDALYFTVTTLTTTGFGDITLQGSVGRVLAIAVMVIGVALFLRLIQTIFRPSKVRYRCPDCGLSRHDPDAIHCKHCGRVLDIETEGAT